VYIDANSISPTTATQISEVLRRAPIDFVDASIFGLASQIRQRGTLFLSGLRAKELSEHFEALMSVKVVGDVPGQASALKMILSGISKGLSALFMESMLFAQDMHLLNDAIETCDEIYPSIMEVIRRMLPTYPQHARRRCEELREVEEAMLASGVTPRIVHAVREFTSAVAGIDWPDKHDTQRWTITEIVRQIQTQDTLQTSNSRDGQVLEREECSRST
jgi:3-hydroxyisobutyrate dehydrogenase-like beta-hydroxyacid dehydrogenase